jgi:hypothetical protein
MRLKINIGTMVPGYEGIYIPLYGNKILLMQFDAGGYEAYFIGAAIGVLC